jgi:hypothetical protein
MDAILSILEWGWPAIAGTVTWLVIQFAARPYLRFRMLRATVQTHLVALETTMFVFLARPAASRSGLIKIHNAEIDKGVKELRETGIALIAMADTEWLLNKLLTVLGYDLRFAGGTLMSLPVFIGNRSRDELSPPFDEKADEIVSATRDALRLPKVRLM